jgi:hypothetical protein
MDDGYGAKLEERIAELEARLGTLEDVEAIKLLKARYGALVDSRFEAGDLVSPERLDRIADDIAALFSEDAVWDGGKGLGLCRGRDEIKARLAKPTMKFTWHYFVKPQIEVSGDSARADWDIFSPCTTSRNRAMWMAGVEHDQYRKLDGVWLHTRMQLDLVFLAPYDKGWAQIPNPD